MSNTNLYFPPIGLDWVVVSASVSTKASGIAAGIPPFRGLHFITTSSLTIVNPRGHIMVLDAVQKNTTLWIAGDFVSAIATATAVFALY